MTKQRRSVVIVVVVAAVIAAFFGFRALTEGDGPEEISLDRYTRQLDGGQGRDRDDPRQGPHRHAVS